MNWADELAARFAKPAIPAGAFTAKEYMDALKAAGSPCSFSTALLRLRELTDRGEYIRGEKVVGRATVRYYWPAAAAHSTQKA